MTTRQFLTVRITSGCCVIAMMLAAAGPAAAQSPTISASAAAAVAASLDRREFAPRQEPPAFSELFTGLKADFTRMGTEDNMLLFSVGLTGAFAAQTLDSRLSAGNWGRTADHTFGPGRVVGGALAQGGAALATYLVGRAIDQPRVARLGAKLVRAQIVAQTTTQFMKFSVQRTRPDGTTLSFPSGHTSATFATATVLQGEFGWKVGVPAYAMAAWIGASRMQSRRHFLSDVITGATIGIMAGRAVTFRAGASRFALTPVAVPGGAGINVVRLDVNK